MRSFLTVFVLMMVATSAQAIYDPIDLLIDLIPPPEYDPDETGEPWEPPCGDCAREFDHGEHGTIPFPNWRSLFFSPLPLTTLPPELEDEWTRIRLDDMDTDQEREAERLREVRKKLPDWLRDEHYQIPGTCEDMTGNLA